MKKRTPYTFLSLLIALCAGTAFTTATETAHGGSLMPEQMSQTIKLPNPRLDSDMSIEKALLQRRSTRKYKGTPLTRAEVSQLLWAAQGMTDPRGFRTAPSAGALYPLEVYLVAGNVDGIPAGIYRYIPQRHEIAKMVQGDKRAELRDAALGQEQIKQAAAVLVISAFTERTTVKYRDRGIRYVHMEAGHAAQNVYLQATALGLGTVVIGAFHDDAVRKIMNMPDREQPLTIMPVGR
jgi:SagB-type dehydrogenase family enzyme